MWTKLSNAIRVRPGTPGPETPIEERPVTDVLAGVYEQHPNLSVFHNEPAEVPFPTPSPPASPSRHGRRNMFKRMSKTSHSENADTFPRSGIPKKVKSSLQTLAIGSESSLSRVSAETMVRQSQDSIHPSVDDNQPPCTPISESKAIPEPRFGSLRSILKPNNTPGTGQSVRFFSRDAYRVISPEQSSASEFEDPSMLNRMQRSTPSRPSLQEVFSPPPPPPPPKDEPPPPGLASMMQPISPPSVSNMFDLSAEELPSIPAGYGAPLLDSAIEITDTEGDRSMSLSSIEEKPYHEEEAQQESESPPVFTKPTTGTHDRSHSFSFGQTLFHSLAQSSPAVKSQSPSSRNRALSDTVFMSMIHSPVTALTDQKRPELDINDTSQAVVAYQPPERDPFAANAMTYYTPGTMLPPSPPQSNHTRTASREEDMIWSLRTQLALQSELCAQYEVDLGARDELVDALNARLVEAEKECDRRKNVIRNWRKRVAELEKCVKGLEEEVDRSREESVERSVMDEASGEALRMLHRRISELERDKKESDRRESELRRDCEAKTMELDKVKQELKKRDQSERELKAGIKAAKEEMELMGNANADDELKALVSKSAQSSEQDRERWLAAESAWEQERAHLTATNDTLRDEQVELQSQLTTLREEVVRKEHEYHVLKAELEAQWKHAEQNADELDKVKQERDGLSREADALRQKLAGADTEWEDNENRKADLENELQEALVLREELEKEREELEDQLRAEQEHSDELTRALQEREDHVSTLEQQRQYAYDSVDRLQQNIRQRDAEIAEHLKRIKERDNELDEVREGLTRQRREHNRIVDEQSRRISEVVAREVEARANYEHLVKVHAEADVQVVTLTERVGTLTEEIEKLRKRVHDLQQQSADDEMKHAHYAKQRAQDKEDLKQANIAIDSKQTEIEMLKRDLAQATKAATMGTRASASKPSIRRESSIFGTPRPPSVISDTGSAGKEKSDPPSAAPRSSLARSVRPNGSIVNGTRRSDASMGPPSAMKSRVSSSSATPMRTPSTASSLTRSSSVTPIVKTHRRPSSSLESLRNKGLVTSREPPSTISGASTSEQEKENIESTPTATAKSARRASVVVPA